MEKKLSDDTEERSELERQKRLKRIRGFVGAIAAGTTAIVVLTTYRSGEAVATFLQTYALEHRGFVPAAIAAFSVHRAAKRAESEMSQPSPENLSDDTGVIVEKPVQPVNYFEGIE